MTRTMLLLTLTLTACGREPLYFCTGTDFKSVYSEAPIDCDRFQYIAQTGREVLVGSGFITDSDLVAKRGGADVEILTVFSFSSPGVGETLTGLTNWEVIDNKISLGAGVNMAALPHEEIHNVQIDRWEADSQWHGGWEEKGYYGTADVAEWWLGIPRLCDKVRILTATQRLGLMAAGWNLAKYDTDPCN